MLGQTAAGLSDKYAVKQHKTALVANQTNRQAQ